MLFWEHFILMEVRHWLLYSPLGSTQIPRLTTVVCVTPAASLSLPRSHIKPSLSFSILSFLLCWTRMQFAEGSRLWLVAIHKIVIGDGVYWEEGERGERPVLARDQGTEMRTVGLTQQAWWLSRITSWNKNIGKGQEPLAYPWHA